MRLFSKAELINSTKAEREKLEAKIAGFAPEEILFAGTMGVWSVKGHSSTSGGLGATMDRLV